MDQPSRLLRTDSFPSRSTRSFTSKPVLRALASEEY